MNGNSIRWIAIAFALGLCAAYALWGNNSGTPVPQPGVVNSGVAINTGANTTATTATNTPLNGKPPPLLPSVNPADDPSMASVGSRYIRFEPDSLDFGDVRVGEKKELTVNIVNISNKTVHLIYARGSCTCMKPELPVQDLAPGKSTPFKVSFSGLPGKRPESYHIEVGLSEADMPAFVDVKGKVVQLFSVDPEKLVFGRMKKGSTKSIVATIKKLDGQPFTILNAVATQKDIDLTMPVEVPGSNKSAYQLTVSIKAFRATRLFEQLSVLTDAMSDKMAATVPLLVYAEIDGDAVCLDENLTTTFDNKGNLQPFQTTIKRLTPGPLIIESVADSEGGAMTFTTETVDASSVKVSLTMNTELRHKKPFGELRIKTNVETEPIHVPYSLPRKPSVGPGTTGLGGQ